jgi:oligoendopeptidase F
MGVETTAHGVTWDLSDLYASIDDAGLDADLSAGLQKAERFAERYRGMINVPGGPTADLVATALAELEAIYEQCDGPPIYAELVHASDARPPEHGALVARTQEQVSRIHNELVFFSLEWLALDDEDARRVADDPACARYRHYLRSARRYQPHVLSEPEEKLLEETANTGRRAFARLFDELLSAMRFGVEVDGKHQELNESGILALLHDSRGDVRRRAAAALTHGLESHALPLTYIFNVIAQDHALIDRLRRYPDPMAARNLANEIDAETVSALIEACERNVDIVADYYRVKQRLLGLEVLHDYDRYAPIEASVAKVPWPQACDIVLSAYGEFSSRMREIAQMFFERRWIDAEVREGKRGGAFSSAAVPSVHPYVLLNYLGSPRDVMTVAHELGHGVHQYLARDRGYLQCEAPLTTAETASIFGELLVFENLRRQEGDRRARLSLLCEFVEEAFGSVFRQIALTRFEQQLHACRRRQGELSSDKIGAIWQEANTAMYGDSVLLSEDYRWWWAYIPHFIHSPFYCYAYSFGELLVLALYELYREEGETFVPRYLEMLAAGGSEAPPELLRRLGVEIRQREFWERGLGVLRTMVQEIQTLAAD